MVDASDPASLAQSLTQAVEALGGLDAAWSNVGVQVNGSVEDASVEEFDRCWALNVRSHFVCAKAVFPHLARADGGSFLITASNSGLQTEGAMVAYATTKAAAVALARNLARDAAPLGIRVNALCPGFVDTPFNEPIWKNSGVVRRSSIRSARRFRSAAWQRPTRLPSRRCSCSPILRR